MPAGVSWSMYLRLTFAATLAMAAGSQMVHLIYRPLDVSMYYVYCIGTMACGCGCGCIVRRYCRLQQSAVYNKYIIRETVMRMVLLSVDIPNASFKIESQHTTLQT